MSSIQLLGFALCCLILIYAWLIGSIINVKRETNQTTSLEGEKQDVIP